MRNPWREVNTIPQPPLFPLRAASVTLQCLTDLDDETVIFSVQSVDPISGTLNALWSSPPVPFDRHLTAMHEAHREWLSLVWDATGPFAEAFTSAPVGFPNDRVPSPSDPEDR